MATTDGSWDKKDLGKEMLVGRTKEDVVDDPIFFSQPGQGVNLDYCLLLCFPFNRRGPQVGWCILQVCKPTDRCDNLKKDDSDTFW